MARIITGTQLGARGKAAGMVYQKGRKGETIQRRLVVPANPQTGAQMAQRIIFGTITQAAKFMEPIVNHSFEGVRKGLDSVNRFTSLNVGILRGLAADDFAKQPLPADSSVFVTTKGVSALIPNRYQISDGSLSKPRMKVIDGGANELVLQLANLPSTNVTAVEVETESFFAVTLGQVVRGLFGLTELNEQLTLCAIARSSEDYAFSYGGSTDIGYQIPMCAFNARRLVFSPVADLSQEIIVLNADGTVNDDAEANIAAAIVSAFRSEDSDDQLLAQIEDLLVSGELSVSGDATEGFKVTFTPASSGLDSHYIYDIDNNLGRCYAAGVIRSKLVDGSWRRSRSYMTCVAPTALNNNGLVWSLANPAWFRSSTIAESTLFLNEGGTANEVGENF